MKVVSFTLWGDQPRYCQGAVENVKLVGQLYPGWKALVYVDRSVPKDIVDQLNHFGAETFANEPEILPCMRRFLAHDLPEVDTAIFRDCDSRLSSREVSMVDQWLNSNLEFHVIRDHPGHASDPMLAGMWGVRKVDGQKLNLRFLIKNSHQTKNEYGTDQFMLKHTVWPYAKDRCFVHEDFSVKESFVGQVFDENNNPVKWSAPKWS